MRVRSSRLDLDEWSAFYRTPLPIEEQTLPKRGTGENISAWHSG